MTEPQALRIALAHLKKEKFLLLVDNRQPSLVTLITREKLKGSWFGHKLGHVIYNTANRVGARKQLIALKLIDGKYTYVAPPLRDAAYALTAGGAPWQEKKLTPKARRLLTVVGRKGQVPVTAANKAEAKLLESLLLASSEEEHTPSGKHVKMLVSWKRTAKKLGHKTKKMHREEAERAWDLHISDFNKRWGSAFRLPWHR